MASTFSSSKVATGVQARNVNDLTSVYAEYALTAALVDNDVIKMVKVPKGAVIQEVILSCPDLDSHGTPTLILQVGDGTTVGRFIADSTVGQAGGVVRLGVAAGLNYKYTAEDTIDIKVTEPPATGATEGTIRLTVLYTNQF